MSTKTTLFYLALLGAMAHSTKASLSSDPVSQQRIAVLGGMPPLVAPTRANELLAALQKAHLPATILPPQNLADPTQFNAEKFDLLILPNAAYLPGNAETNLLQFLQHHGRLLCIGGPAFIHEVFLKNGRWSPRHELLQNTQGHPIFDFQNADPSSWNRAADTPNTQVTVVKEPSPHGTALLFQFENYRNWANLTAPAFATSPFKPGENLTLFWAKGAPNTNALVMEWVERDGSRWITAVPLTTHWQRYVLLPSAFRFWEGGQGRGGHGDLFHPQNAMLWRIGLANSHAPMPAGNHQFWIADLEVGASPYAVETAPPDLPTLCPDYRGYETSQGEWRPVIRERGLGLADQGRPGRLVLPAGITNLNEELDNSRWLYVPLQGPYMGTCWGGIALAPHQSLPSQEALRDMVLRLLQPAYIAYGGVDEASYPFQTPVVIGAKLISNSAQPQTLRLRWHVESLSHSISPPIVRDFMTTVSLEPYQQTLSPTYTLTDLPAGEYRVTITLQTDRPASGILDRLQEPFRVLPMKTRTASLSHFVRVEGGEFVLDGKPWRPVGVNFWPSWIAGQRVDRYQHGWLSPDEYDPVLVQQDLDICHRLGFNVVSVQYTRPDEAPALNDFLIRCRNLGIKANVFLAYAHPLYFDPEALKKLLDAANLRGNDTVFAFDVAWEPHMGDYNQRKAWDPQWQQWIKEQYGSLTHAEEMWGMKAPRDAEGNVTGPSDQQLSQDGPWRIFVAAYRRFLDDLISRGYAKVVQFLRPYGPLIGARSGYGGNGSPYVAGVAPFDLVSGAAHLDFISPEGYALDGDWPTFRGGGFTAAYARWAGNGKPVFWAEFGRSVLPANPQHLEEQRSYYDKMCRLILDTGSNGTAAWWFPGGLRIDENSDFGIISPDGTPRPAALRLSQLAIAELPKAVIDPKPTTWLEIDRDKDARGYAGLYAHFLPLYAQLREQGEMPGVRTRGTNTTTATVPLTAVGDLPLKGMEPLQFVNGEILPIGTDAKGFPQRFLLTNTGEAKWLAAGAGRVGLMVMSQGRLLGILPLTEDVPRYGQLQIDATQIEPLLSPHPPASITLRLVLQDRSDASNRIPFGQAITLAIGNASS